MPFKNMELDELVEGELNEIGEGRSAKTEPLDTVAPRSLRKEPAVIWVQTSSDRGKSGDCGALKVKGQ